MGTDVVVLLGDDDLAAAVPGSKETLRRVVAARRSPVRLSCFLKFDKSMELVGPSSVSPPPRRLDGRLPDVAARSSGLTASSPP